MEGRHDVLGVRSTATEGFGYFREHLGTAVDVGCWIEIAFGMLLFMDCLATLQLLANELNCID